MYSLFVREFLPPTFSLGNPMPINEKPKEANMTDQKLKELNERCAKVGAKRKLKARKAAGIAARRVPPEAAAKAAAKARMESAAALRETLGQPPRTGREVKVTGFLVREAIIARSDFLADIIILGPEMQEMVSKKFVEPEVLFKGISDAISGRAGKLFGCDEPAVLMAGAIAGTMLEQSVGCCADRDYCDGQECRTCKYRVRA
jgi:hypothetical protein